MNWDKLDELVASWARPYTVYASVTTLCVCAIWIADTRVLVIPILGTLAGGVAVLRTVDKKTSAAAVADGKAG